MVLIATGGIQVDEHLHIEPIGHFLKPEFLGAGFIIDDPQVVSLRAVVKVHPVNGAAQRDGGAVPGAQPRGGHLSPLAHRNLGSGGGKFALGKFISQVPHNDPQHQPQAVKLVTEPGGNIGGVRHHPVDVLPEEAADLPIHLLVGQLAQAPAAVLVYHLLENIVDGRARLEGGKFHPLPGAQPQHFITEKLVRALVVPVDGGGGQL